MKIKILEHSFADCEGCRRNIRSAFEPSAASQGHAHDGAIVEDLSSNPMALHTQTTFVMVVIFKIGGIGGCLNVVGEWRLLEC